MPSSMVRDLDPAVERVILRCLEHDPALRPGSALAVAAALPGGDPLAAALAAGETPSPEMVAAAGETTRVQSAIGAVAACAAIVGTTRRRRAVGSRAAHREAFRSRRASTRSRIAPATSSRSSDTPEKPADYGGRVLHAAGLRDLRDPNRSIRHTMGLAGDRRTFPSLRFWYLTSPRDTRHRRLGVASRVRRSADDNFEHDVAVTRHARTPHAVHDGAAAGRGSMARASPARR